MLGVDESWKWLKLGPRNQGEIFDAIFGFEKPVESYAEYVERCQRDGIAVRYSETEFEKVFNIKANDSVGPE